MQLNPPSSYKSLSVSVKKEELTHWLLIYNYQAKSMQCSLKSQKRRTRTNRNYVHIQRHITNKSAGKANTTDKSAGKANTANNSAGKAIQQIKAWEKQIQPIIAREKLL